MNVVSSFFPPYLIYHVNYDEYLLLELSYLLEMRMHKFTYTHNLLSEIPSRTLIEPTVISYWYLECNCVSRPHVQSSPTLEACCTSDI